MKKLEIKRKPISAGLPDLSAVIVEPADAPERVGVVEAQKPKLWTVAEIIEQGDAMVREVRAMGEIEAAKIENADLDMELPESCQKILNTQRNRLKQANETKTKAIADFRTVDLQQGRKRLTPPVDEAALPAFISRRIR